MGEMKGLIQVYDTEVVSDDENESDLDDASFHSQSGGLFGDHTGSVTTLLVQDNILFSGANDSTIRLYDLRDIGNAHLDTDIVIKCQGILGKELSAFDRLSEPQEKTNERALQGHTDDVTCLTYVDGKLYSGSADGTVRIWDFST